jgi:hypothetical protein
MRFMLCPKSILPSHDVLALIYQIQIVCGLTEGDVTIPQECQHHSTLVNVTLHRDIFCLSCKIVTFNRSETDSRYKQIH